MTSPPSIKPRPYSLPAGFVDAVGADESSINWQPFLAEVSDFSADGVAGRLDLPVAEWRDDAEPDNRAAARRISKALAVVGLGLCSPEQAGLPAVPVAEVLGIIEHHVESIAAAEHASWMAGRVGDGWIWGGTRDDEAMRDPSMTAYARLPEAEKAEGRAAIRRDVELVVRGGWLFVRLASG